MAQGRPFSRHGRCDAFIGMQLNEADNNELYRKAEYQGGSYASPRPKSGYKSRSQSSVYEYDQYARVTTPRDEPVARPMSRRRHGDGYAPAQRMSLDDSDDSQISRSPVTPDQGSVYQQRPPSSSRRPPTSGRPPSARPMSASHHRVRSARKPSIDREPSNITYIPDNDMPEMPSPRPPSSFSKYRLLPSIGTPTPPDFTDNGSSTFRGQQRPNHLYNVMGGDMGPQKPQAYSVRGNSSHARQGHNRISSAVSDISVISTRATSRSQQPSQGELNQTSELIERLDLSALERDPDTLSAVGRRRKSSSTATSSPASNTKPPGAHHHHQQADAGDLYDGDDDDSDSAFSSCTPTATKQEVNSSPTATKQEVTKSPSPPPSTRRSVKKPVVVIPSPNHPADSEVLLAIKLPTDGTRHQRYFRSSEPLHAVVEFAEEVAGQDFGGYILVSSAPKCVYSDLEETIEAAGLEDKTTLHLEEND